MEKPVPRPPTPTIDAPTEGEEDEELSIVLLQQLLRGRAVQLKMREGKRRRRELIRELRGSHALQEAEQKLKAEEKKQVRVLYNKYSLFSVHLIKPTWNVIGRHSYYNQQIKQYFANFLNKEK